MKAMKYLLTGISIVLIVLFICLAVYMMPYWKPEKYAVSIDNISNYKDCMIVRETWHTGTGWEQIGDENGYLPLSTVEDVYLIGNIPLRNPTAGDHVNTYLCIVERSGTHYIEGSNQAYQQFTVTEWYPIYPVKRNTILPSFLYPKNYLSKGDIQ